MTHLSNPEVSRTHVPIPWTLWISLVPMMPRRHSSVGPSSSSGRLRDSYTQDQMALEHTHLQGYVQLTRFFTAPWFPLTLAFWHETIVFVSIKAIFLHVIIPGGDQCGVHVTLGYAVARRSTVDSDNIYIKTSDTGPTQDCLWWRMRCYPHYTSRSTW